LRKIASLLVGAITRLLIRILAKADTGCLKSIPKSGPLILIFNHVNFLEVPLLYLRLKPRPVRYMAKSETWEKPFLGWMADNWQSIRVYRGEHPLKVFEEARRILDKGKILLVSPEGTRSENGILQKGREGTVLLALHNNAIIIPIGHSGAENIGNNMKNLKRTRVQYKTGRPFRLKSSPHPGKYQRELLTNALMRELAVLLPEEQRGIYRKTPFDPELLEYID